MAKMYPKNITEYMPTDSERIVYEALKTQLPDTFDVFYSVQWSVFKGGRMRKSEADFVIASPQYGFLCLEVKGGTGIRIEDNKWFLFDAVHGERKLNVSPYEQAEKSMYYLKDLYSQTCHLDYPGIYGAGVIFPFYSLPDSEAISNRNRDCTIDFNDMSRIYDKIKRMFRCWGGKSYGYRIYKQNHHHAFLELIRKRIAVSAAAGALVQYKERQLDVINRVQDSHIYFLSNVRQFYVRGGAGTGKTWIAMKMAKYESSLQDAQVLFLCASSNLATEVKKHVGSAVDVLCVSELFAQICSDPTILTLADYRGISSAVRADALKYTAIFIDEAQDFTVEWARTVCKLLKDPNASRLGVFYDDSQILQTESFGDGFGIALPPFLLRENIRNTANIYTWASTKTNLGSDMIANPVEGPTPVTEYTNDKLQLTYRIEQLLNEYLEDECLPSSSLVLIVDDKDHFTNAFPQGIAKWSFVQSDPTTNDEVRIASIEEFKGLESDMVIYIHSNNVTTNENYIAYTRAKYYLIELVRGDF